MDTIILKIGKDTKPMAAAVAAVEYTLSGRKVQFTAIGVSAVYNCSKTLIWTKNLFAARTTMSVAFRPEFADILTPNDVVKTAVRWDVVLLPEKNNDISA